MVKNTFTTTQITGPSGNKYPLLTANEYPWMNCQVIPTPPERRDEIMAELYDTVLTIQDVVRLL